MTRDWPLAAALKAPSPNHWTNREFLVSDYLKELFGYKFWRRYLINVAKITGIWAISPCSDLISEPNFIIRKNEAAPQWLLWLKQWDNALIFVNCTGFYKDKLFMICQRWLCVCVFCVCVCMRMYLWIGSAGGVCVWGGSFGLHYFREFLNPSSWDLGG